MIAHMVSETERVFKGKAHKNSCQFYHDDLLLMTAKQTHNWMKKRYMNQCGSYPKLIYFPATPSSNATEVVHL